MPLAFDCNPVFTLSDPLVPTEPIPLFILTLSAYCVFHEIETLASGIPSVI